jgi:hypothetical protein
LQKKKQVATVDDVRQATAEVFVLCIMAAVYDLYGIGEARLQRIVDAANERAVKYESTKTDLPRLVDGVMKTGPERAELELCRDVEAYFPADFLLPVYKMPKKRDLMQVHEQRRAADGVARLYAYALHTVQGFGVERVACVMKEATGNYSQFRDYADSGDYYGYAKLAQKVSQILHADCDVVSTEADTPIFGKTLD